jgi:hypothetical protein
MNLVKTSVVVAASLFLSAVAVQAKDEPFLSAGHKMLGHQVQSSQEHAQAQAQTLYYHAQAEKPLPKDDAKELVASMRKDLAAADKALAQLKAEFSKNKEAVDLIESIKKHHAKATEVCGMAEEACMKGDDDKGTVGDCCSDMYHELEAAKVETDKLLKSLKIGKLDPPKKGAPAKKK